MESKTELVIDKALVEKKIQYGYRMSIEKYFSEGWEIFKKEWFLFSIYALLHIVIIYLAAVTVIGLLFVLYPLMMGYVIAANKVDNGEPLSFGDFFGGFKRLGKFALLTLIPMLIMFICLIPFGGVLAGVSSAMESGDANAISDMVGLGSLSFMYLILIFVGLLISLALFFAPYLIIFSNYDPLEAFKTSFKMAQKNIIQILLFVICVGILGSIGSFLCLIGVFASMGFAYTCYYPMMKDTLLNPENVNDNIPV